MNCEICGKSQKTKNSLYHHYKYHLKKETNQNQIDKITTLVKKMTSQKNIFTCGICKKNLSSKRNLDVHRSKCSDTAKKQINDSLMELNDIILAVNNPEIRNKVLSLTDKITTLFNMNENIRDNITNLNNNSGNVNIGENNNINNINNNVFNGVRSSDKKSIDMYDAPLNNKKELIAIFGNPKLRENIDGMFLTIDKYFNYNKNYPENHNILVTNNKKYKPCLVKENDEWIYKTGEALREFFYDRIATCNELYINVIPDKLKELYPEKNKEIDEMSDYICNIYSDDPEIVKKKLWSQFFDQAYFNKNMMKETYQKDIAMIKRKKDLALEK